MQIVIKIDDETYNDIKKGKIYSSFRDVPLESVNAIANGIPLDKIREEINGLIKYYPYPVVSPYQTNNHAMLIEDEVLQIIDKYIGGDRE